MAKKGKEAKVGAAAAPTAKPSLPKPSKGTAAADPRFAAALSDPRFQRFPARKKSVSIDERFAGIFEDPDFQAASTVDKRGRKVKRTKHKDDMRKYYRLHREGDEDEEPAAVDAAPKAQKKGKELLPAQPATSIAASGAAASTSGSDSSDEEGSDLGDARAAAERRYAAMRGIGAASESSSSSSDEEELETAGESSGEELDTETKSRWGIGAMAANPQERIPMGTESRRLAAMDLNWGQVRAVDIFAALGSFLPAGGRVDSVTVYPSDYGLQRMAEEAISGPQGIYKPLENGGGRLQQRSSSAAEPSSSSNDSDTEAEATGAASDSGSDQEALADEDSDEGDAPGAGGGESEDGNESDSAADEVDQTQLRMYERSKLRYYYAIVQFDSVDTALRVYTECDGLEFQLSSCKFDLRFVPDEQSFEGRQVRDRATSLPEDYVAPVFQALALQHTNVKLTWDADDRDRKQTLGRRVTKDELRDDDFKAYLASESEESEPDEAQAEKYRALLAVSSELNGADTRKGGKGWGSGDDTESQSEEEEAGGGRSKGDKQRDTEMELTFQGGLEELGQRLLSKTQERKQRQNDTVWEAYERRRREKRATAKARGRKPDSDDDVSEPEVSSGSEGEEARGQDPFFQHDDDPFDDPFFQEDTGGAAGPQPAAKERKAKKGTKGTDELSAAEQAAERRRIAELQLLMMDEDALRRPAAAAAGLKEGDKPAVKLSKKDRIRQKKACKLRERQAGSDDEDLGTAEGADGFKADLADPRFQALLTSSEFALDPTDPRYRASGSAADIQKARAHRRSQPVAAVPVPTSAPAVNPGNSMSGDQQHFKAMVASLKRKAGGIGAAPGAATVAAASATNKKKGKKRKFHV